MTRLEHAERSALAPSGSIERVVRMLHRAIPADGAFVVGTPALRLERVEGSAPSRDLVAHIAASGTSASPSSIELWIDGAVESSLFTFVGCGSVAYVGTWCRGGRAWVSRERTLLAEVAAMLLELPDPTQRRDHLTGLLDRGGLLHVLAQRGPGPGTVVFVDLDGLKAINDRHGHAMGDEAIRAAASALVEALGTLGVAARWGGDELVAWSPEEGSPRELARRIQSAIRARRVAGVRLDASLGVAVAEPSEPIEHALARADRAMYRSKRAKRGAPAATPAIHRKSR
ncbi:MAG: GGDEF domain-containing protein [Sandaracinus sp.]